MTAFVPAVATGVSALVTVLAGVGMLVDRPSDTPAPIVPAAASSVVATTPASPAPAPRGCVMFCEDPGPNWPEDEKVPTSPAPEGCRLFCELERGREGGGF
ncbi:hypothetical protein U3653_22190 [Nocardia sp. CDC186]|uniref:Secreted protein n=1 Tax=Nocardia implantans TaxID=3108168 RepID=A0ABU6AZE1_9NOCA|nr:MULTISPECIES: hypothetical protein [unclassified Nocardia]MBF6194165.1 hypothetical protein [Nocardia beijingensis]MEA3529773.1 hypothetical protein [Nocardia sp. CDC192]MEB3512749.1 hypothetical protein [Nocardia sp. CDC186]